MDRQTDLIRSFVYIDDRVVYMLHSTCGDLHEHSFVLVIKKIRIENILLMLQSYVISIHSENIPTWSA